MNSYLEAREKIIQAYYKDELDPYNTCACFVGNLLDGDVTWPYTRTYRLDGDAPMRIHPDTLSDALNLLRKTNYTPEDITRLEDNFLKTINDGTIKSSLIGGHR